MKEKLTILFCTCDAYEDLWFPFFTLLKKNWEHCPYQIVINTESKNYQFEGLNIKTINCEKTVSYGQRMLHVLHQIETEYILIMLDDFFIRREVNQKEIEKIICWMDQDSKIASFTFGGNTSWSKKSKRYDGYFKMNRIRPYKLVLQAGVWRTETFQHYWDESDDPWTWELFVNYLTFRENYKFYTVASHEKAPITYGYKGGEYGAMGVYRGKWVKDDVEPLFQANNIQIDYNIRGVYSPQEEQKRYSASLRLLKYSIKRIGWKETCRIIFYEICRRINRNLPGSHAEYLADKFNID
ncbi:MAG: hypothetical protein HFH41_13460 [Lachnospiraceae bacterium]|nr:hypothetical protein [Lachnospiraceae bacterium]